MTTQLLMVDKDHALLEIDHLQIYTIGSLSEVLALNELGLNNANQIIRRETQGTASILFFFENVYLEIIWIEDEQAFRQYSAQTKMNLIERLQWQQFGTSPFGIGLRPKVDHFHLSSFRDSSFLTAEGSHGQALPFQAASSPACHRQESVGVGRERLTEWADLETKINFSAENLAAIQEPICFTIPYQIALTNWLDPNNENHQQLITHPLGIKKLTDVKIKINTRLALSNAVSLLENHGIISIEQEAFPLLELTFDRNAQNQVVDARPLLPILLRY